MKKPTKKLLVFLIALAVVIIAGVVVLLLASQGDDTPGNTETPPVAAGDPSPSPTEPATTSPYDDEGFIATKQTVEGTIYTVTQMPGGFTYSFLLAPDTCSFEGGAADVRLTAEADRNDFIHITYHEGTTPAALAPRIMDGYVKYNEFEQSGLNNIPGTDVAGETVEASDGSVVVKAWLVKAEGGVLAVVIRHDVSDPQNETAVLYDVLKTLKIAE
jgi:hypothetical protein